MSGSRTIVKGFGRALCISALALAPVISGCSPVVSQRGYVPTAQSLEQIAVGSDTRQTVARRLGSPSTIGTFESDVWYYISQKEERKGFYKPKVADRKVVAVAFNPKGTVDRIDRYGMEDGQVIDLVTRETPTRGRDLSILRELFGNIGRFNENLTNGVFGSSTPSRPGQ